jgi:L-fuculose-phosphate aldolase
MILETERAAVCAYARRMVGDGLVVGTSGNVSLRAGDLVAVTPTGVAYSSLTPGDIAVVDLGGQVVDGSLKPTSELPMHLSVYWDVRDPDSEPVTAVVHTHSPHATAVSTLVREVPPIHYIIATIGPSVRVARYATYGTPELAAAVLEALEGRRGCLLANHGTLTYGDGLEAAYHRAQQLEWVCRVWLLAQSAGRPSLLPPPEVANVVERLRVVEVVPLVVDVALLADDLVRQLAQAQPVLAQVPVRQHHRRHRQRLEQRVGVAQRLRFQGNVPAAGGHFRLVDDLVDPPRDPRRNAAFGEDFPPQAPARRGGRVPEHQVVDVVHQRGHFHHRRVGTVVPGETGRLRADEIHVVPPVERQPIGVLPAEPVDPITDGVDDDVVDRAFLRAHTPLPSRPWCSDGWSNGKRR